MRALWLPQVLRAAGLTVHEVPGWRGRGSDAWGPVRGITCHHTAGSRTSSVQGEINVLLNGSTSAPPPIAQLLLARNGEVHVVASGTCFHNKVGWDGPNEGYGNDALLGIEAQHSGGSEPWTAVQYRAYVTTVAALVRHDAPGWDVTVARVAGHKEHQPGSKSDPTFNMNTFRADVTRKLQAWAKPPVKEDDMTPTETRAAVQAELTEFHAATGTFPAGNYSTRIGRDAWNQSLPNPFSTTGTKTEAWEVLRDTANAVLALRGEHEAIQLQLGRLETALGQVLSIIDGGAGEPPTPQG